MALADQQRPYKQNAGGNVKYNALIIGAGSIGSTKPDQYDSPTTKNILTHAHAVSTHENIRLSGIIDSDYEKALKAADKWGCVWFTGIDGLIGDDIVVIATPTETHLEMVQQVKAKLNPKIIILEKPCGMNLDQARNIKAIAGNTPIAVNYIRRYDPVIQNQRENLLRSTVYSATFKYCRGMIRDGSHMIDILNWFFGDCLLFEKHSPVYEDYSPEDPTYSAHAIWARCPLVSIQAINGMVCDMFELDVMTSIGSYRLVNHFNQQKVRILDSEKMYGNYTSLNETDEIVNNTFLGTDMLRLYDNVIGYLEGREALKCTIDDAIKVHEVIV